MATHSSIPAWEIPRTEEPGGLRQRESQRGDTTRVCTHYIARRKASEETNPASTLILDF